MIGAWSDEVRGGPCIHVHVDFKCVCIEGRGEQHVAWHTSQMLEFNYTKPANKGISERSTAISCEAEVVYDIRSSILWAKLYILKWLHVKCHCRSTNVICLMDMQHQSVQ